MENTANSRIQASKKRSKKTMLKFTIPLIIALLSSVFTLVFTNFLNRDKLRIASISVRPQSVKVFLTQEEIKNFTDDLKKFDKYGGEISLESVMDEDEIKNCLEQMSGYLLEIEADLSRLNELYSQRAASKSGKVKMKNELREEILKYKYLRGENSYELLDADELKEEIANKTNDSETVTKNITGFIKIVYRYAIENKDNFQAEVVLFNAGGKQAVAKYKGQLNIDNMRINLKRRTQREDDDEFNFQLHSNFGRSYEEFLNNFILVQPKSFNGMTLVIDKYNNKEKDIISVKREFLAGLKKAKLKLYDINNRNYLTKEFAFRDDFERDQSETLLRFLKNNYKKYLPE